VSGLRLLVTGAAGYLGGLVARRGVEANARVLGLDVREPGSGWPAAADFERRDVTDPALVERVEEFGPEVVVHLAWIFDPTHDEDRERRVDLEGTVNVFRAAVEAGARRIVYPSSTTSYGIHPGRRGPFREEEGPDPNPGSSYAYFKARVEEWLPRFREACPGVELVVLRACIVIGPHIDNVVSRLTRLPLMPRVAGHDPPLQFLHEDDAEELLWWAATEAPPGTYNAAGHGVIAYSRICRAAGRIGVPMPAWLLAPLVALGWHLRLLPFPPGLLDYIRYPWVADTGALREAGFEPRFSTRDALRSYLEARSRGRRRGAAERP